MKQIKYNEARLLINLSAFGIKKIKIVKMTNGINPFHAIAKSCFEGAMAAAIDIMKYKVIRSGMLKTLIFLKIFKNSEKIGGEVLVEI